MLIGFFRILIYLLIVFILVKGLYISYEISLSSRLNQFGINLFL